ncbi:uncharacterized protein LOC116845250 [Odontomachus brunneus]|uniref:uncharacterized protein LOC116845250 n=1 Tax=Odontomachus brunneus TaxID=486640 RepID=UPI0013F27162|nr:uncharacterized protein LOC116845250 [Odontomachus brunneus]
MEIRVVFLLLIFSGSVFGKVAWNEMFRPQRDNRLNLWDFEIYKREKYQRDVEDTTTNTAMISDKNNSDSNSMLDEIGISIEACLNALKTGWKFAKKIYSIGTSPIKLAIKGFHKIV